MLLHITHVGYFGPTRTGRHAVSMTLINRSPALLSTLAPEKGGDPLAGRIEKKCRASVYVKLELEAVLQCCSLVEHEVVRSCVRILEEVTYSLELNRDA